jgi:hypothetical protein
MALANKAEAVTSGSISGRTQVDSLAYEGRLATAVDKTSVVIRRRVRRRGVARSKPGAIGYCLVLDAPSAEGSPFVASDAAARRCSTVRTPSAPIADAARRIR